MSVYLEKNCHTVGGIAAPHRFTFLGNNLLSTDYRKKKYIINQNSENKSLMVGQELFFNPQNHYEQ